MNVSEDVLTPNLFETISNKLYKLHLSGVMCDVLFIYEETSLSAHSCILAVVSPFMMRYILSHDRACKSDSSCHSQLVIPISVVTKSLTSSGNNCMDCISNVIRYIYTGQIHISTEHFQHIVNISCNLEINELISICQMYNDRIESIQNLNDENYLGSNNKKSRGSESPKPDSTHSDTISLISDPIEISETSHIVTNENIVTNCSYSGVDSMECESIVDTVEYPRCLECQEMFASKDLFKQHRSVFHSNKFNCLYCEYKSYILQNIIKHMLETNHGNKCSICLREFQDNATFIAHTSEDHMSPLPFHCSVCNIKFKTRALWKRHLITHSNNEAISCCTTCKLSFNTKTELKIHILKSHKVTRKTCEFCSYTSKYSSYMKRHMLKHGNKLNSCEFPNCKFQTVRVSNLKEHMKIHQRSYKEFQCSLCEIQFSLKKNLLRHMRIHDKNQRIYKCPKCHYTNNRLDKVKAHCLTIHPDCHDIIDRLNNQHIKVSYNKNEIKDSEEHEMLNAVCQESVSNVVRTLSSINLSGQQEITGVEVAKRNNPVQESSQSDSTSNKAVYLNESTGELTILCDSDGKPLKGVPDVITIHSIGGMGINNFDMNNGTCSSGVFLNEITGELTYIQLNFEPNPKLVSCEKEYSEVAVTVLDEATGEITSKPEQIPQEKDVNILDVDNIFDSIDFDAMNDDSWDRFDDFDNAIFESEFSIGSASPDMDKILNEFTGELFTDESACRYSCKPLTTDDVQPIWEGAVKAENECIRSTETQDFAEIFLDEVTGELRAEFTSLIN